MRGEQPRYYQFIRTGEIGVIRWYWHSIFGVFTERGSRRQFSVADIEVTPLVGTPFATLMDKDATVSLRAIITTKAKG